MDDTLNTTVTPEEDEEPQPLDTLVVLTSQNDHPLTVVKDQHLMQRLWRDFQVLAPLVVRQEEGTLRRATVQVQLGTALRRSIHLLQSSTKEVQTTYAVDSVLALGAAHGVVRRSNSPDVAAGQHSQAVVTCLKSTATIFKLFGPDGTGSKYSAVAHRFLAAFLHLVHLWFDDAFAKNSDDYYIYVLCDFGYERSITAFALFLSVCEALRLAGTGVDSYVTAVRAGTEGIPPALGPLLQEVAEQHSSFLVPALQALPLVLAVSGMIRKPQGRAVVSYGVLRRLLNARCGHCHRGTPALACAWLQRSFCNRACLLHYFHARLG
jgi:hypothetical protein